MKIKKVYPIKCTPATSSYTEWHKTSVQPIVYRARRSDTGDWIESVGVYSTTDGKFYLSVHNSEIFVDISDGDKNIYSIDSADNTPFFVEIIPETLEWRAGKER